MFFDKFKVSTALNFKTTNDIMYIEILRHKVDTQSMSRDKPIRDNLGVTKKDYREFKRQLPLSALYMQKWLNTAIFNEGIHFPFNKSEFQTQVFFKEKTAHLTLEIEE